MRWIVLIESWRKYVWELPFFFLKIEGEMENGGLKFNARFPLPIRHIWDIEWSIDKRKIVKCRLIVKRRLKSDISTPIQNSLQYGSNIVFSHNISTVSNVYYIFKPYLVSVVTWQEALRHKSWRFSPILPTRRC